jgi:hypothetical protein
LKKIQILLSYLFLFSNSSFLPYLLLALFVKNLSFFHICEVCWNKETGSVFFFVFNGVLSLNVYAAVSGLLFTYDEPWDKPELFAIIGVDLPFVATSSFGFN